MSYVTGNPAPSSRIVRQLRTMAEEKGMITDEKRGWLMLAADRIEDLEERVAIMEEGNGKTFTEEQMSFPYGGENNEKC